MMSRKTLPTSAWNLLGDYLRETRLLGSIQSTLYWDQNTMMPPHGANWRGEQLSLLAKQLHSRQCSEEYENLLMRAKEEFLSILNSEHLEACFIRERTRNIELLEQDLHRQKKLDSDLVVHLAIAKAKGYKLWQQAKLNNDFASFVPALKELITLRKAESTQLSENRSCWETLAQPFEPDLNIKRLNELFSPLRKRLPELIEQVTSLKTDNSFKWDLDRSLQQKLCDALLEDWGRNNQITALAQSPHPFSITLGPQDFRITTRIVQGQPFSSFLATAHEWGHSLYEQGLPSQDHQWFAWPLGQATSMALHESQSLFWENRIVRSFAFAEYFWPHFKKVGAPISSGTDLWKAMNPMSPGLNRVEADELSYGLHILIRTDLEIALLEENMRVEDLPHEWNKKYKDLLGVSPKNDTEGCLQDVHWSEGMFGYFPSYLLGHLINAQLTEKIESDLGPISELIESKKIISLIDWLRNNIHHYGRTVNAEQLVKEVSGKELSPDFFIKYIENKCQELSALS